MDVGQAIGSGPEKTHKKRLVIILTLLFLIIIVAGGFFVWIVTRKSAPSTSLTNTGSTTQAVIPKVVCSTGIIQESGAPITNSDQVALGAIVNQIVALKDYDHDPNCLYIALQYALASGDSTSSINYLNKLERVYDPAIGFSSAFSVPLVSLSTLQSDVNFVVQNAKSTAESSSQLDSSTVQGSNSADKFQQGSKSK